MEKGDFLKMTADVVSAYFSNNSVGKDDVAQVIGSIYDTLASVGEKAPAVEEPLVPAVSVRASVKPDSITCLECGFKGKILKRHLSTEHNLTTEAYRARWGLGPDYPMVAPVYAQRRRELAVQNGLGRKPVPKQGSKTTAP